MKLSWKIMTVPLVAGIAFFLFFAVAFIGTRTNDRTLTLIQDSIFHTLELSHDLETSAMGIRHLLTDAMTSGNADLLPEADLLAHRFRSDVESCRQVPGLGAGPLDTLGIAFENYFQLARSTALESASSSGDLDLDFDDALLQRIVKMNGMYESLLVDLRAGVQRTNDEMEMALSDTRLRMIRLRRTMNVLAVVFLVIMLLLSFGVLRAIVNPVHHLSKVARAIAQGDLGQKLDHQSDDVLGRLADSFREMQAALIEDIRHREAAEADLIAAQGQIIQSEKMAVLGKLVAGLTHELNTPLGALTSSANVVSRSQEILARKCDEGESLEELRTDRRFLKALKAMDQGAVTVNAASVRISQLVEGLKAFSQLDHAEQREVNINEGLTTTYKLLQHQVPQEIKMSWELGELPRVMVWPAQLHQLFLVLMRNAMESIEGAGTISISSAVVGKCIQVIFKDTGHGYNSEQLQALFDPGFRAHSQTVRMDWGMISAGGIADHHGGTLHAESEPGRGSSFVLSLPVSVTS